MTPVWSILIATLSRRQDKFTDLLGVLLPQCEAAGNVEVIACSNDAEESIGSIRQRLLEAATGEYVSFIDDDDMVTDDFVATIVPLLADSPDIVGFNITMSYMGNPMLPSFCSIRFEPHDDSQGFFRDITHVNPIRRELALKGSFRDGWPEDFSWRSGVRPHIQTEAYIDREMYQYRHDPRDSVQMASHHPTIRREDTGLSIRARKDIDSPVFRYLDWP